MRILGKTFFLILVFIISLIIALVAAFMVFGVVMLGTFVLIPAIDLYIPSVILALFVFVVTMLFGSQKLLKRFDNHLENAPDRLFNISFSLTIIAPFFLIGCACSIVFLWMLTPLKENGFLAPPPSPDTLLAFSENELACIGRVNSLENITYLKKQKFDKKIAIGYSIEDQFYTAIISIDENDECQIEYHEKIWDCDERVNEDFIEMFCNQNVDGADEMIFKSIETVELTGESPPEIYIWIITPYHGSKFTEYHAFYSKQDDSAYERIYERDLCRGFSAIEIDESSQLLKITDDLICKNFPDDKIQSTISLKDGVPVTVKSFEE